MPQKAIQTVLSDKEELSEFCLQTTVYANSHWKGDLFSLTNVSCILLEN